MSDIEVIILTNTCVGSGVHKKLMNSQYNNPFISTLITNDLDYIKLCNNINYYITCEPVLGNPRSDTLFATQNSCNWYCNVNIRIPYPIIFLGDIEIHCIHENNASVCLDTFKRRLNRMKEIIYTKPHKIIGILSFSELINDHDNIQSVIDLYLSNSNNIFVGPLKYKKTENDNYLGVKEWDTIELIRDTSHIYSFNNQPWLTTEFYNHIKKTL